MHALYRHLGCNTVLTLSFTPGWELDPSQHAVSWPLGSVSVLTSSSPRLTTGPLSASWRLYPSQPRTHTLIKLLGWKRALSVQIYGMGISAARTSERYGRTSWQYSDIVWKDGDITVKCSVHKYWQHMWTPDLDIGKMRRFLIVNRLLKMWNFFAIFLLEHLSTT